MKKKSKKGYKLSEETKEKLRIQEEARKKEEEETKKNLSKKEFRKIEKIEKNKKSKDISKDEKISIPKAIETIFSMVYLGFLIICIWKFFGLVKTSKVFLLFGCLATILAFGDSFHLIPRIINNLKTKGIKYKEFWFGLGTQISSITMTWFYLLLYITYKKLFPENLMGLGFDLAIYITVGLRIIICLLPQNNWYTESNKNTKISVIRNLIFLVTGILEIILFARIGNKFGYGLWKMAIAIGISFACYLPVSLGAKKYPKLGILMIPKTLCYMWMLYMGLDLIGKVG